MLTAILLLCCVGFVQGGKERLNAQVFSVPADWASIWTDLGAADHSRLDEILDSRLSQSSLRTVKSAVNQWWFPLCNQRGWNPILQTNSRERGSRLACFVMHLMDDTSLVYSSIADYVWGVRTWQKMQRQADPIFGIMGWDDFMASVKVMTWVPHEPRKALSVGIIKKILVRVKSDIDGDGAEFWEVQFCFLLLILLFTFSRSECPLPKNFTGEAAFDKMQHWLVADIQLKVLPDVGTVLGVRFKAIKQDPRIERPEARGTGQDPSTTTDGDWVWVGDVSDSVFSIIFWYQALCQLWGRRREMDEPFFVAKDKKRPYTYGCAMMDLHSYFELLNVPKPWPGLHGIRVEGNNLSRDGNGAEITDVQGGWKPGSRTRYDRFDLLPIANIPAKMLNLPCRYGSSPAPREVFQRDGRAVRKSAVQADVEAGESESDVDIDELNLPPGFKRVLRDGQHLSRSYYVYESDLGTFDSRPAAWTAYSKAVNSSPVSSLSSPEAGGKSLRPAKTFSRAPAAPFIPPSLKSREVAGLVAAQGELFGRASQDS